MKKKVAAGCIAAAALITAGSFAMVWQDSQVPELPSYTDPVVEQTLTDDDTPLASKPKVTTKTTKKSKTTKKNNQFKESSNKNLQQKTSNQEKNNNKNNQKEPDNNSKNPDNSTDRYKSEIHQEIQKGRTDTEGYNNCKNNHNRCCGSADHNKIHNCKYKCKKREIHNQQCSIHRATDGQQSTECLHKDGIYCNC